MQRRFLILTILLAFVLADASHAQVLYGSLTGNVTDATGAIVPGAKVTASNVDTGAAQDAITDERGGYLFSNLQAGVYKVTVTLPSFKTLVQDKVQVEANTVRRLDAHLEVGRDLFRRSYGGSGGVADGAC